MMAKIAKFGLVNRNTISFYSVISFIFLGFGILYNPAMLVIV
jgi:hypothetical protein